MFLLDLVLGVAGDWILTPLVGALTSAAGLALPAVGFAGGMLGMLLGGWRKWVVIGAGLAGVAIYVLVIKLDAAGEREARLEAEKVAAKLQGERDLFEQAVAERDRNFAIEQANHQACGERLRGNLNELRALQREHRAALEAQARVHRDELAQRLSLKSLKEKTHASAMACPGPLHPADRDYVDWMCERARARGEDPPGCAAAD